MVVQDEDLLYNSNIRCREKIEGQRNWRWELKKK